MRRLLDWIDGVLGLAWCRIKKSTHVTEQASSCLRVIFGLYMLVLEVPRYSWLGDVPDAFYAPPILSLASLFSGFPDRPLLTVIDWMFPVLFFFITVGIRARWSGILAAGLFFSITGFKYSFGKIDHSFTCWLALLMFSFSNWGVRFALVPDRRVSQKRHESAIALLGIFIAFGMLTAGVEKARNWVDFDLQTGGFLSWFYRGYFNLQRDELLAPLVLKVDPRLFEIADYTAVAFELSGFLVLLLGRRAWRSWLLAAGFFHLCNTLLLNIVFDSQFIAYAGFILPLVTIRNMLKKRFGRKSLMIVLVVLSGSMALVRLWSISSGIGSGPLFGLLSEYGRLGSLYWSCAHWSLAIVLGFWNLWLMFATRSASLSSCEDLT